ncbi:hypothetical protein UA08_05779 [Talaromyces atroroseus]|uniref:Uncharacterized protein n=1 Tax=Talaromyces atroroseus TaxID=1441469 RepID=A0A225AU45_TALAT|nr:hypothetical protein UA08_05779 [Talaromyces atroroseus]OKL59119.1 hypothetical protein UA08_05779 [Talaromyces atroroseus]
MEHISTLCAVSTVGIAATGFSLARREQQNWSQSISSSRHSTLPHIIPTETVNLKPFHSQTKFEGSPTERTQSEVGIPDSKPNLVISQRRRERRRRQTYANPPSKLSAGEASAQESSANSGRPSSSWLRRISIISSTNTSSSTPSPTTTSPPVNRPYAQTSSRRNSINRAPNKLIKRSASQHSIKQPEDVPRRPRSNTFGLRRPATSHQRSSKVDHRASISQDLDLSVPPKFLESLLAKENDRSDLGSNSWKPFFASAYDKRRKESTSNAIVTIKPNRPPNSGYYPDYPTLMLSSSIQIPVNGNMATNHNSSQPTNVIPFRDPFSQHINANNANHITTSNPKDKRRPIRSSSISDLSGSNRKTRRGSIKGDNKSPTAASRFYSKDRIVSNPFPRTSGTGKAGSPRLRRKRNFTESDTFNRPQTAPNAPHLYSQSPYADAPFSRSLGFPVDSLKLTDSSIRYRTESYDNKASPTSFPSTGTSPPIVRYSRNQRLSGATSDWASTLIGSDDTRVFTSADEDDQSDSVFDSFRTRMSSGSHPGRRGPHIETIFNDLSDGDLKKGVPVTVDDLGFENLRLSQFTPGSSLSDVNSMSTPLALSEAKDADATPTPPTRNTQKTSLYSSPVKPVDHRIRESVFSTSDDAMMDDGGIDLDASFEEGLTVTRPRHNHDAFTPSLTRQSSGIGTRASVFDWSERDPQAHEIRPSTVHGKQVIGPRSTRRATRKVPSAIHLRSQSVPVSRDGPTPSDSRQPSAKFGTWGLGQKGVSEDWDGDFDFGDDDLEIGENTSSMHTMKVPQAIMETQASVHGQYGHVQELTLLVEELKRLRAQGNTLHLIHGASGGLWKEAEGIVNLATFEDDENSWQVPGSPSSCGSFDDFDTSPSPPQKAWKYNNDNDTKRPPLTFWSDMDHNSKLSGNKDPSAKAKSVLETIYQQRGSSDTQSYENASHPQQKLPFDTQSLKELVTRAGVVTRALKDVIRRAEGVTTTDEPAIPSDPPFSRIFAQSSS